MTSERSQGGSGYIFIYLTSAEVEKSFCINTKHGEDHGILIQFPDLPMHVEKSDKFFSDQN